MCKPIAGTPNGARPGTFLAHEWEFRKDKEVDVRTNRVAFLLSGFALLLFLNAAPLQGSQTGQATPSARPADQAKPPAPPAEQAKQPAPIEGDLAKVDADAKTLVVKIADGTEVTFLYNDKTEVSGADGPAGLATMKEGRVTVHFTEDKETKTKTATRIIVQRKK